MKHWLDFFKFLILIAVLIAAVIYFNYDGTDVKELFGMVKF